MHGKIVDIKDQIKQEALSNAEEARLKLYNKFFQNYKGGYGYGDTFMGIKNPPLRAIAKKYKYIPIIDALALLEDKIHEVRLLALFILEAKVKSKKLEPSEFKQIAEGYMQRLDFVNNWDLVDASSHHILGFWLYEHPDNTLEKLAEADHLWRNRIAMIATFYHIRKNSFELPLQIAEKLINHKHDLIHKAVGWMLREIGKRNLSVEETFLKKYYKSMPRTMLRYAIEKFDEPLRLAYLKGRI